MSPKDNYKKVSAAVRILHQKRDASARATHLKAGNWIVQSSTIERKIMSTKTSFKRIALVAASALALGGFSVISAPQASAAASSIVLSKNTLVKNGVALAASAYTASKVLSADGISSFNVTGGDTVTLKLIAYGGAVAAGDSFTVGLRGFGNLFVNDTVSAGIAAGAEGSTNDRAATTRVITVTSVPGTYTLDISYTATGSTSVTSTTSVTMVVAAATAGYSSSLSSVFGSATSKYADSTSDAIAISATKAPGTAAGYFKVNANNAAGAAVTSGVNSINATLSGPGYVIWSETMTPTTCAATPTYTATIGRSVTAQTLDSEGVFLLCSDGTSGTASLAVTVTDAAGATTALATKTATFYGSATKLAVHKSNYLIGKAGANTTGATVATGSTLDSSPAFVILETDAEGRPVNGGAPTITSADATIVASASCALDTNDSTYGSGPVGYYNCSYTTASSAKSGQSVVLTAAITDPADSTKKLSTTVTIKIGGVTTKEVISFDKGSYSAGEAMTVTITATDASGNPVYDGAASPALTANKAVGGALLGASVYVGGKKSSTANTLYAPAIGGDLLVTATGTDAAATALSAMISVDGDNSSSLALDAANAATDAANNAYDEAQNATQAASDALAAVTALARQVKSLIASVKKLTKSVAKLS